MSNSSAPGGSVELDSTAASKPPPEFLTNVASVLFHCKERPTDHGGHPGIVCVFLCLTIDSSQTFATTTHYFAKWNFSSVDDLTGYVRVMKCMKLICHSTIMNVVTMSVCLCMCMFFRLLLVGGCESGDVSTSKASCCGITAWRTLSGSPHYKQVTSYEDDVNPVRGLNTYTHVHSQVPHVNI